MRLKAPDRMDVIKKEDKEARLFAFVNKELEELDARSDRVGAEFLLVLRSSDSPVSRALASLASSLAAAKVAVRVVIVQASPETIDREIQVVGAYADAVKLIRDVRLLDAHEQLVLNASAVWIGDCMRRDPAKRDAFENYAENRPEIASWATTSFNRLWDIAEPVIAAPTVLPTAPSAEPEVEHSVIPRPEDLVGPEVATRH